ncbi:MAG: glycosyltransferase family 2 protein [Solirubrobacterales bacterium]
MSHRSPPVTVVIPTHDHGPLVELAARSALDQTTEVLEVLIVGDGAPEVTSTIAAELSKADARVTYFDNPKGPGLGEVHRHAALQQAQGEVVMYLADDDLWLPDHVEHMLPILAAADFANTPKVTIGERGGPSRPRFENYSSPLTRKSLMAGRAGPGISFVGHTMDAYRKLPFGWRTRPAGTASDVYMWQQFVAASWLTGATGARPTALRLASPPRSHVSIEDRLEEMKRWAAVVEDPLQRADLYARICAAVVTHENRQRHKHELAAVASPRRRISAALTEAAGYARRRRDR